MLPILLKTEDEHHEIAAIIAILFIPITTITVTAMVKEEEEAMDREVVEATGTEVIITTTDPEEVAKNITRTMKLNKIVFVIMLIVF